MEMAMEVKDELGVQVDRLAGCGRWRWRRRLSPAAGRSTWRRWGRARLSWKQRLDGGRGDDCGASGFWGGSWFRFSFRLRAEDAWRRGWLH